MEHSFGCVFYSISLRNLCTWALYVSLDMIFVSLTSVIIQLQRIGTVIETFIYHLTGLQLMWNGLSFNYRGIPTHLLVLRFECVIFWVHFFHMHCACGTCTSRCVHYTKFVFKCPVFWICHTYLSLTWLELRFRWYIVLSHDRKCNLERTWLATWSFTCAFSSRLHVHFVKFVQTDTEKRHVTLNYGL